MHGSAEVRGGVLRCAADRRRNPVLTQTAARLSEREWRRTLAEVLRAFKASDAVILKHLHGARISHKSDGSEVTVADRGAERLLRRRLRALWPRDAVLGEEYGGELKRAGRCWLLDPIDGTASYVLGLPMFGTLVSLLIDGEPVFGCIRLSALRETTYAARGFGCHMLRDGERARRVRVAAPKPLEAAHVGLTSYKESNLSARGGPWQLAQLVQAAGRMRLVGDCVQYALLCRGVLDAAVDPAMKPWDIGALAICVQEAGGSVSDLTGAEGALVERRSLVAASSDALRGAICRIVSPSTTAG
jgi:histidinol-phosphatase